jgi:hypothetical protein
MDCSARYPVRSERGSVILNLITNAIQALSNAAKDPRNFLISTSMDGPHSVVAQQ